MSKKINSELIEFCFSMVILSSLIGTHEALNIVKQVLSMFNSILIYVYDTTILNEVFNHFITYSLVGLILMKIGSPIGREGDWIGKILYFILGCGIGSMLNFLSNLIF